VPAVGPVALFFRDAVATDCFTTATRTRGEPGHENPAELSGGHPPRGFGNAGRPPASSNVFFILPRSSDCHLSAQQFALAQTTCRHVDQGSGKVYQARSLLSALSAPSRRPTPPTRLKLPPGRIGHGEDNFFPVISTSALQFHPAEPEDTGTSAPIAPPHRQSAAGKEIKF